MGGYLNAYTSREQTAFHARVLKNDVPLALDLIADILVNSTLLRRTSWSASARWCCRNWARRATRPTISSSIICKT